MRQRRSEVSTWQARAAILVALPSVCPDQIRDLLDAARARSDPRPDARHSVVWGWQKRNGLDRVWIEAPLQSMVACAIDQGIDVIAAPDLWLQQLWDVSGYAASNPGASENSSEDTTTAMIHAQRWRDELGVGPRHQITDADREAIRYHHYHLQTVVACCERESDGVWEYCRGDANSGIALSAHLDDAQNQKNDADRNERALLRGANGNEGET
jgi:hypothetical protein